MSFDLPQLPSGWDYKSLETCTRKGSISYGVVQPGTAISDGVPIIRVNNFRESYLDTLDLIRISPEIESKYSRTRLQGGEVLITIVGSVGQVAVTTSKHAGFNVARAVAVIHPNNIEPEWISFCLQSPLSKFLLVSRANTTVQTTINLKDLRNLPIPVPPKNEREAMTRFLVAVDDRITLLRETNTTLEAIAQALFKSWFVDFDPVHAKQQGRAPEGMDAQTAALFPDSFEESELGMVPKGWSWSTLAECTSYLNRGISPKYVEEGGIPVINQKCIRDFSVDFSKARRHDPALRKIDGRELKQGDVLVNSTGVGTLGRVAQLLILDEPTIVDSHVTVVRAGQKINSEYLGCFMQWKQPTIEDMGEGSTGQTELSRQKLGQLEMLQPGEKTLLAFKELVNPLKDRISLNEKSIRSLATLRDTLLPRLISGQLRLPEAQAAVEGAL